MKDLFQIPIIPEKCETLKNCGAITVNKSRKSVKSLTLHLCLL